MILIRIILNFIFISTFSITVHSQVSYQFPATDADVPKLIETIHLMSFLSEHYQPDFSKKSIILKWNFDWNKSEIAAGSQLENNEFSVLLYGGFIRMPESDFRVVALALCHELGHFLAGAPYQKLFNNSKNDWSSAEGQADWFAANNCLPVVFEKYQNQILKLNSNKESMQFCTQSKNRNLCQFVTMAGYQFSVINFKYFNNNLSQLEKESPEILKNSTNLPLKTLDSTYPSMQCRLDTYKKATLCFDSQIQKCDRPRCWFNPIP